MIRILAKIKRIVNKVVIVKSMLFFFPFKKRTRKFLSVHSRDAIIKYWIIIYTYTKL